jgi:lipopolysaccharide/colanic/teichoic acid biosynthesis glycosyltransferase
MYLAEITRDVNISKDWPYFSHMETDVQSNDTKRYLRFNSLSVVVGSMQGLNGRRTIAVSELVNNIPNIDKTLSDINQRIELGNLITGRVKLNTFYKIKCLNAGIHGGILYATEVFLHRVFPKLNPNCKLVYDRLTKGKEKRVSRTEMLGRLVKCGFSIVYESINEIGEMTFVAEKKKLPYTEGESSYWPIFKMRRVGKNGEIISVFKFRTMSPYAEFLQEYIKQRYGLEVSGKFSNDFRITSWGKFFRKCWIDELPMIVNLIKGDLKLVGVRPISPHYLSLYPDSLKDFRSKYKPGLIPPFYADLPKGFEEILASEEKYLLSYTKNPFRTDVQYFCKIFWNILVKRARSK